MITNHFGILSTLSPDIGDMYTLREIITQITDIHVKYPLLVLLREEFRPHVIQGIHGQQQLSNATNYISS